MAVAPAASAVLSSGWRNSQNTLWCEGAEIPIDTLSDAAYPAWRWLVLFAFSCSTARPPQPAHSVADAAAAAAATAAWRAHAPLPRAFGRASMIAATPVVRQGMNAIMFMDFVVVPDVRPLPLSHPCSRLHGIRGATRAASACTNAMGRGRAGGADQHRGLQLE